MENKVTKQEAKRIYRENNNRVINDAVDGFVVLKDINKVYDNRVQAVFDFNLSVKQNEFIVLVGPSGCGKSTTLRMIAGLEEITGGYLYIDRVLSNYLESKDRDIAMVFQSYALYPNMTVYDNIGFGLKVRGAKKEVIREKVFEAAKILDLGAYLDRKPKELSGGQMQRVALGRAIVRNAKLFLMDEPLSNLDAKLRVQMRSEIVKLHKKVGATTIYVTHDQTEAMTMADRIVIMNKGLVQQTGTPMEIYNNPENIFVATFIGNPPMNVFRAGLSGGKISADGEAIDVPAPLAERYVSYVRLRRAFFEDFSKKADLTAEHELLEDIGELLSRCKKLSAEELTAAVNAVADRADALAREKGFVRFGAEQREALLADVSAGDYKSLRRDFRAISEEFSNTDLQIAGILKKFDSAGAFREKESAENTEVKKKKNGVKNERRDLSAANARLIEKYRAAYGAEEAERNVYVGIRPEDVRFYDEFNGNKSLPVSAVASFVELLGSEYCIYLDIFGTRIIMKTGTERKVETGDRVTICFNMDKLCVFDSVSGERVR